MYADFFDPPAVPYVKGKPGKGKGKEEDRKGKKGKTPAQAPKVVPTASTSTEPEPKRRSVRFSDAVKVKTIAARGSEFEKLVNKFGWDKAEQMTRAKEAGEEMEDERVGGEGVEELVGGEEEEIGFEEEEDVEMEDGEEIGRAHV